MDPLSLTVASLVATGALQEVGAGTTRAIGALVARVREGLSGDARSSQALSLLEEAPDDDAKIRALAALLEPHLAQDLGFRSDLEGLIEQAKHDGRSANFVINVEDQAQIGKVVQVQDLGDVGGD